MRRTLSTFVETFGEVDLTCIARLHLNIEGSLLNLVCLPWSLVLVAGEVPHPTSTIRTSASKRWAGVWLRVYFAITVEEKRVMGDTGPGSKDSSRYC